MEERTLAGIDGAARFIAASRRLRRCDTPRYAVYFAPEPGSAWWRFGCAWLGRDPNIALARAEPLGDGFARSITREPRQYGFHATLKAPFRLAPGHHASELHLQASLLARELETFTLPPLEAVVLDGFVALMPVSPCAATRALAERCVAAFDNLRAPPSRAELARRQLASLTARQSALFAQWGYPYVLDEFRFHLTLTGKLARADQDRVLRALAPAIAALNEEALRVDALSVFMQHAPEAPFLPVRRYAFGTL